MKKTTKTILIAAIILVVAFILIFNKVFSSGENQTASFPPGGAGMEIPVKAHITEFETLSNNVIVTGTILANEEVELRSEVAGKVTDIFFKEGSYVKEGDLLVKINDADLQAQLRKAKSKVDLAKDKEFRQKQLYERNLVSQEEYQNALNELNSSEADYDLIKAQIDKTEIHAPFSGIIGIRSVSVGSYITTSTVIATLQNLNNLKVDFSIPEKYSTLVKTGDRLSFNVSGSDKVYEARVYAIEPKIDPATRTLRIRAICEKNYKDLIPGAFANVELSLKQIEDALMVPSVSIVPELKGQRVYLIKSGVVVPQKVELGMRDDRGVQIINGLSEGDTVITSGLLQIRPGAKVKISEFN